MMIECPHCHMETEHKVIDHINIDRNPELRAKVQDLSCFRIKCPNCGETALAVHPCLYHDMSNQFMVWLWPEQDKAPKAEFDPLAGYRLRIVDSLNGFREKISILEHGLDDRTIEIMKLLLFSQLNRDLDVVELLFHEYDERTSVCMRMWTHTCIRPAASLRALTCSGRSRRWSCCTSWGKTAA